MSRKSPALARPRSLTVSQLPPANLRNLAENHWWVDFGRAAFGTVKLALRANSKITVVVHLGEKLDDQGRLDRQPPGSVRYRKIKLQVAAGKQNIQVEIPSDQRNTRPGAILMPQSLFEVMPFRYAEIEFEANHKVGLDEIWQLAVFYPFNDNAADFQSSNAKLDQVWELCKYSIKATSFCAIYVDGDRERIPYEADAYINQLCHYGVDAEYEMARHSLEYLIFQPTWPTEWALHFLPMAWADYQYTGRTNLLAAYYDLLRRKALLELARKDGLISTETGLVTRELLTGLFLLNQHKPLRDLVDWPPGSFTRDGRGERDNYDMVPVKTAVNAFHAWNLRLLTRIATVLNKTEEAKRFDSRYRLVVKSMERICFRKPVGIFVDGENSDHASLHANMLPAAFGLIPAGWEKPVLRFIKSRDMACSVYGAQYLLEACYRLGAPDYALSLMTAEHDRGWLNMLKAGSTITLEAWDYRYKNNLDWNHAWGAAPANLIPRFLAGVRPYLPGFAQALIAPQPAGLKEFKSTVPTQHGPIIVQLDPPAAGKRWLTITTPVPAWINPTGIQSSAPPITTGETYPVKIKAGHHEIPIAIEA